MTTTTREDATTSSPQFSFPTQGASLAYIHNSARSQSLTRVSNGGIEIGSGQSYDFGIFVVQTKLLIVKVPIFIIATLRKGNILQVEVQFIHILLDAQQVDPVRRHDGGYTMLALGLALALGRLVLETISRYYRNEDIIIHQGTKKTIATKLSNPINVYIGKA